MDHKITGAASPRVLFVSGTGRSGTNITKQIFAAHPQVATLPFEYRFIIDPGGIIDFYNSFPRIWSPFHADHKIKALNDFLLSLAQVDEGKRMRTQKALSADATGLKSTPPPYAGWELGKWIPGYEVLVNELTTSLTDFQYPAVWPGAKEGVDNNSMVFSGARAKEDLAPKLSRFLVSCIAAICQTQQRSVFLEDNTWNILFASDLLELVPNSRLLHIVRDPRDVLASLKRQRWAPSDIEQLTVWYSEIMEAWEKQKSSLPSGSYMEARFEDMVTDKGTTIARLADFSGLSVTREMTQIDLSLHHIGRYKSELTKEEVRLIEQRLAKYVQAFGY